MDLLRFERLYRGSVRDGGALAEVAEAYRIEFNTVRPHEEIGFRTPLDVYLGRVKPGLAEAAEVGDGLIRIRKRRARLRRVEGGSSGDGE